MNRYPYIILTITLILFAYSVTLKEAPARLHFTDHERIQAISSARPAAPIFRNLNANMPGIRLYQSHFDEYRTWCNFDMIGRRTGEHCWTAYRGTYEENTAVNLREWLLSKNRTHILVNPAGEFVLPTWDPDFKNNFIPDMVYGNYIVYRIRQKGEDYETRSDGNQD